MNTISDVDSVNFKFKDIYYLINDSKLSNRGGKEHSYKKCTIFMKALLN